MLNRYEHADADRLVSPVREALPAVQALIAEARERDVPIVYVNDNYGEWSAGSRELCERALQGPHRALVEPVLPSADAAFIAKARHSIFYESFLDAVAHIHPGLADAALELMQKNMHAQITSAGQALVIA